MNLERPPRRRPYGNPRIRLSSLTRTQLEARFPGITPARAIDRLVRFHDLGATSSNEISETELWVKLDRLEAMAATLAIANLNLAESFQRSLIPFELPPVQG